MKFYYITNKNEHAAAYRLFSSSHYIDLPNGNILLAAEFGADVAEKKWRHRVNVLPFPHPMSGQKIGTEIASHLQHLGVLATHSTFDAVEIASSVHPLLKMGC